MMIEDCGLWIADWEVKTGMRIEDCGLVNPKSEFRNPKSNIWAYVNCSSGRYKTLWQSESTQ